MLPTASESPAGNTAAGHVPVGAGATVDVVGANVVVGAAVLVDAIVTGDEVEGSAVVVRAGVVVGAGVGVEPLQSVAWKNT